MASLKRGSDDDSEGPAAKMSKREEDDGAKSGGRTGRLRKKSAKVLEMEEFEEIEKKQFTKKSDSKGKTALTPPGPKKVKVKGSEGMGSPLAVELHGDALSQSLFFPGGSQAPDQTPSSPVKASTKQAIGAKVKDSQGSVIKLLLSSPAIPTAPSVSTAITKTSPALAVVTTSALHTPPPPAVKKGMTKVKIEPLVKQEMLSVSQDTEDSGELTVSVKSDLMDPQSGHIMLSGSALSPDSLSPIKTEPGTVTSEGLGSLKLKLMMSPKDTSTMDTAPPTSGSLPALFTTAPQPSDTASSLPGTTSKSHVGAVTKKKAPQKKRKAPGEKAGKQASKRSAAEQMPNLAALVSTPKQQKAVKEETPVSLSEGLDSSLSDASLDMSSIVESALDMEEEAALVIADVGAGPGPVKPRKKKAGGGVRKKSRPPAAMDIPGLDSDEGLCTQPDGDIAALAAKVQRSSGGTGGKKKVSKKTQELQEAQDKKKRPSRRAPTAYMLYCNSQRPKVVAESPGIDFAQISRTLGVMWQCLSKKEKMMWRRKSKKLAGKGSTLISTGKGNKRGGGGGGGGGGASGGGGAGGEHSTGSAVPSTLVSIATARQPASGKTAKSSGSAAVTAFCGDDTPHSPVKGFGIEPIDIAAHLKLLGESLSIIGNRLQEHKGLIAVQGSLSVLLDSMLCACGPLLALTHQVPGLDGCSEATHSRTLDRVAYIMPGL